MNVLSKLKKMFNNSIECKGEFTGELFYFYPKNRNISFGKNILVPENTCAVFVHKGKLCDILFAGKYKIEEHDLPRCFDRQKIKKQKKKGKNINSINCDIYFINFNWVENFVFTSQEPFVLKTQQFGKVVGFPEGICKIKIRDVKKLMQWLLQIRSHFRKNIAEREIGFEIGLIASKLLEKSRFNFTDIITQGDMISTYLNGEMEESFEKIGFEVEGVELHSLRLNKKVQEMVSDYLLNRQDLQTQFATAHGLSEEKEYFVERLKEKIFDGSENSKNSQHNAEIGEIVSSQQGEDVKLCSNCGGSISQKFSFCPLCGNKIDL